MRAKFHHRTGDYAIEVVDDDEGVTNIKVTTTNPPSGLANTLYEFTGKLPDAPRPSDKLRAAGQEVTQERSVCSRCGYNGAEKRPCPACGGESKSWSHTDADAERRRGKPPTPGIQMGDVGLPTPGIQMGD